MFKNILVAYEGSEYSNKAFEAALEIAASFNSQIYVVSVIAFPESIGEINSAYFIDSTTEYYKNAFETLKPKILAAKVNAVQKILTGIITESLLHFAKTSQIDLISIGIRTQKRSLLNELILGSVSKEIVENATCSVLVIK